MNSSIQKLEIEAITASKGAKTLLFLDLITTQMLAIKIGQLLPSNVKNEYNKQREAGYTECGEAPVSMRLQLNHEKVK